MFLGSLLIRVLHSLVLVVVYLYPVIPRVLFYMPVRWNVTSKHGVTVKKGWYTSDMTQCNLPYRVVDHCTLSQVWILQGTTTLYGRVYTIRRRHNSSVVIVKTNFYLSNFVFLFYALFGKLSLFWLDQLIFIQLYRSIVFRVWTSKVISWSRVHLHRYVEHDIERLHSKVLLFTQWFRSTDNGRL